MKKKEKKSFERRNSRFINFFFKAERKLINHSGSKQIAVLWIRIPLAKRIQVAKICVENRPKFQGCNISKRSIFYTHE